tara:strand:+ start:5808 stop:6548 length:741 start_codon:yes stop_codon:yes gene_type:complete
MTEKQSKNMFNNIITKIDNIDINNDININTITENVNNNKYQKVIDYGITEQEIKEQEITEQQQEITEQQQEITEQNNTNFKVYRFKFSDNIIEMLIRFTKLHAHDSRQDYKEAWDKWYLEQDFESEKLRLKKTNYKGDFENKLYTAGRYYFRKKNLDEPKKQVKRRKYISVDKDVIDLVDIHIKENINNECYTPSKGYLDFCNKYKDDICKELKRLLELKVEKKLISEKIKKLYKNRFNIINSNAK